MEYWLNLKDILIKSKFVKINSASNQAYVDVKADATCLKFVMWMQPLLSLKG